MTSGLADPELAALLKANNDKMIKQKFYAGYNNPPEEDAGLDIMIRGNLFGQEYEKYASACQAFAGDFGNGRERVYFQFEFEAPNDAIEAFKPFCDGLTDKIPAEFAKASIEFAAGKILFQMCVAPPGKSGQVSIPQDIIAALAGQD